MTERPILFSGEMVKAILEGRKTQTRRVCKYRISGPNPPNNEFFDMYDGDKWIGAFTKGQTMPSSAAMNCPYGQPGATLWVRESLRKHGHFGFPLRQMAQIDEVKRRIWSYAADKIPDSTGGVPSIHMPRWASRITLEVTKVRVERVQDISEEDVEAEGVVRYRREFGQEGGFPEGWNDSRPGHGGAVWIPSAFKDAFRVLWDSINEKRGFGWAANPWCWVVEFQRIRAVSEGEQEC